MKFIFNLTRREIRSSWRRLLFFFLCIALGVGSIVAGQYRIKQRMGSGASGVIYEAQRVRDGLPVALKMLRMVHATDAMEVIA